MISIDYKDGRPIYEQIVEKYKTLILKNVIEPGEQMPSVRRLAMDLSTNPNTVQKAYAELERQGFIYTVKGRGNYVSDNTALRQAKKEELQQRLRDLIEEAEDLGITREELLASLPGFETVGLDIKPGKIDRPFCQVKKERIND